MHNVEIIYTTRNRQVSSLFQWTCSCGAASPLLSEWPGLAALAHATARVVLLSAPGHEGKIVQYVRRDRDGKRWRAWGWSCSCGDYGSCYSSEGYARGTWKTHCWRSSGRRKPQWPRLATGARIEEHW